MNEARAATIEDMSELAEALFDIIEEENAETPDLRHAVVEALAHQNLFNIEMLSALSILSEGGRPEAELDNMLLNMKSVHKSLVRAITAWSEEDEQ